MFIFDSLSNINIKFTINFNYNLYLNVFAQESEA